MKLSPNSFTGFLLASFLGIAYSLLVYYYFYNPDYSGNHYREFFWESKDTTYCFKMREPATMKGYFTHPKHSVNTDPSDIQLKEEEGWFFLNMRPNLLTWIFLFTMFNGLCFGIFPYLLLFTFTTFRWPEYSGRLAAIIGLTLASGAMVVLLTMGIRFLIPEGHLLAPFILWHFFPEVFFPSESLIFIIQIPGYIQGLTCILAMMVIGNITIHEWGDTAEKVRERLVTINQLSYHILAILSVVLVLIVLTTYFMFRATQENISGDIGFLFPERSLIIYGAVFTFFILLFYIPTYYKIRQLNEEALAHARDKKMKDDIIVETSKELMKLTNPRLLLTIASPVITSLFPSFIQLLSHI